MVEKKQNEKLNNIYSRVQVKDSWSMLCIPCNPINLITQSISLSNDKITDLFIIVANCFLK